jgi:hypothetical protein
MELEDLEVVFYDAKHWRKLMRDLCEQVDKKTRLCEVEVVTIQCPYCEGTGFDGYDRSIPPNPYICQLCDGEKKIEIRPKGKENED